MQRYFVESREKSNIQFTIDQEKHILKVMRMRKGDCFYVVLLDDVVGKVEIISVSPLQVVWKEDVETTVELPVAVTIACGLPKGDKLEWIVQKATELGVQDIVPLETTYSVVKWDAKKSDKKIERLQKIAAEAAEQSHRSRVPKVCSVMTIKSLAMLFEHYTHVLLAYEESAKQAEQHQFKAVISQLKHDDKLLMIFGSEGGLSPEEVAFFEEKGAKCCALGPRILRTETAPLYALSAISYAVELK